MVVEPLQRLLWGGDEDDHQVRRRGVGGHDLQLSQRDGPASPRGPGVPDAGGKDRGVPPAEMPRLQLNIYTQ